MSTAASTATDTSESEVVGRLVWEAIQNQHFNYDRELGLKRLGHLDLYEAFKHITYGPIPDDVRAAIREANETDQEHAKTLRRADRRRRAVEALKDHPDYLAAFLAVEASSAATGGTKAKAKTTTKAKAKPKRKGGPEYLDDLASARIVLKAAAGTATPEETFKRLDPDWKEAVLIAPDDDLNDWLDGIRRVSPDRAEAIEQALAEAKADPGEDEPETDQAEETSEGPEVDYRALSDDDLGIVWGHTIEPEPIDWFDEFRLAKGKMHILAGEMGDGKSQIAISRIAAVTTGGLGLSGKPFPIGKCLFLTCEDGARDTVVPRMIAAGVDMNRVIVHRAKFTIRDKAGKTFINPITFRDVDVWREIFRRGEISYMVADPIPAFLGRGVNDHKNIEVRQALEPFIDLIDEMGVAFDAITHLNKSIDMKTPTHRITGSIAYGALARIIHMTCQDPEDDTKRYLCQPKINIGKEQSPVAYRIIPHEFIHRGQTIKTARVEIDPEPVDIKLRDLIGGKSKPGPKPSTRIVLAKWLVDFLRDQPGPIRKGHVFDAAGEAGLIGQMKPDKNGREFWSGGSTLVRAMNTVPTLDDDGYSGFRVENLNLVESNGYAYSFWKLTPKDGPTTEEPD